MKTFFFFFNVVVSILAIPPPGLAGWGGGGVGADTMYSLRYKFFNSYFFMWQLFDILE